MPLMSQEILSRMSTGTQAGDVNLDIGAEGEFAVRFTDASAA